MKRALAGCTLLALLAPGSGSARPPALETLPAVVADFVDRAREEMRIPGAAVAVVHGGETILLAGFGYADLDSRRAVDPELTLFRVGSISKALTSTAALRLVADGALDLDADLRPLLAGVPFRPDLDQPLTLHHLLTHTGGFDEVLFGQHASTGSRWQSPEAWIERHLAPRFDRPGRVIAYSDHNTALAGVAITRASGQPFADAMRRLVLEPLGMSRTSFLQVDLGPLERDLAVSYRWTGTAFEAIPRDYVSVTPGAGAWTTAADMTRYLNVLLGHQPASAVMPRELWEKQLERRFSHRPELPGWAYGFAEDQRKGWPVWFKDGQASGFSARLLVVPDLDLGIFSVHNRNTIGRLGVFHDAMGFNRQLGDHLLETFFPDPPSKPDIPAPSSVNASARRSHYSGLYRTAVASRHTPERLLSMSDEVRVEMSEEGLIRIWGNDFVEVEPNLVQHIEVGNVYAGFMGDLERPAEYFVYKRAAWERVPAWTSGKMTRRILAGSVVIEVIALMAGAIGWWRKRRRREPPAGWRWLALHGLLQAAYWVGIVLFFVLVDVQSLFSGWPLSFRVLTWLPVLALLPLVGILASAVHAFRESRSLAATAWTAACLLLLTPWPWLLYWHLVA